MTDAEKLRYRFLDLVADWATATCQVGTDDQIAALAVGMQALVTLIENPPADPIEQAQALERCVKLFFI